MTMPAAFVDHTSSNIDHLNKESNINDKIYRGNNVGDKQSLEWELASNSTQIKYM